MSKPLDFNKIKKRYLTVTLADAEINENGKDTTLMIGCPTKSIMDDLIALQDSIEAVNSEEDVDEDTTTELYEACVKVMNRNKGGIKISLEHLGKIFDVEDIIIFFNAYMDFINEVTSGKN